MLNIFDCKNCFPEIESLPPAEIEKESMRKIDTELKHRGIDVPLCNLPVVKRCIHTSADFDYAENLFFSDGAVKIGCNILKNKSPVIITDTNMALAGINKKSCGKFGIETVCFMADDDVSEASHRTGFTRAVCSVDKAAALFADSERPVFFVCGNAPTALVRIRQLYDENIFRPDFVVGVPVGFVNVVAAKELIIKSGIPCIVSRGNKGGSNIAACIVNALLYL